MITIVEVGLRDGLQNTKTFLAVSDRLQIVKKLSAAGLKRIELGAFVPPHKVPQMKGTAQLVKKALQAQNKGLISKEAAFSAFAPNEKGFDLAAAAGLQEVSVFISCTESFSQKNINQSVKESLNTLKKIAQKARRLNIKLRGYLSAAFYCPYEGRVLSAAAVQLAQQMLQAGVFELSISDTVGAAVFSDVKRLLNSLQKKISLKKVAMHFHDTRGCGLANTAAALQCGVRVFDSSIGGLGGCPYAPGAGGNTATEDLSYMLKKMGFKTGVKLEKLLQITKFLEKKLNKRLPSKLSVCGPL